jgi:wobble nucleotide-excising tRNase
VVGNDNSAVASLIEKLGNSDWVKRGLEYIPEHVPPNGKPCPFCQETTITPKMVESIRSYFDDAYQADINQLEAMLERYNEARSLIIGLDAYTSHQFAEGKIPSIAKKYQSLTDIFDLNITTIETKLKNPGSVQQLKDSTQAVASFNEEIALINAAIQVYNERLKHREKTFEALKDEFWSLMRWQYDQTIKRYQQDLASANSKLAAIDTEIKRVDGSIAVEKNRIKEAQKETINVDEAVSAVNSGLLDLGITDFKIAKHSESLYRVVRGNDLKDAFHTLSEGEKMMISFLYFCELCKGRQSATDTETKKIAVIDDPISSLSHVFIFNVGQLIRNVFFESDRFSQVFILTHSLYFFYELTDQNHERRKLTQKLYRMTKSPSGSKIHEMKYEEIQNDYQAYWAVINDCDQPPALIANCMRNIIEYFFNFVRRKDLNNVFQMPELQDMKYQAFCRYVNRESHSVGQNLMDMKEFDYQVFKEGLRLVFEATGYSEHFKAMSKI